MSEEINAPAAESGRRRTTNKAPESTGGAFKIIAIILALVAAGLGYALYQKGAHSGAQADADAKTIGSLSNQVSVLTTKLALERSNLEVAQSNHQALIHRRTAELNVTSNRLVQTTLLLDRAREETHMAQSQLPAQAAAIATLEARREDLQREAALIPGLQREAAEWKGKFQESQFSQAALQESLGRALAEKAGLERKLEDPAFLRLQARRADEAIELRQRAAANQRINPKDSRIRLDLQPDGTIRPALTATKGAEKK
jgi:hypothetical protein